MGTKRPVHAPRISLGPTARGPPPSHITVTHIQRVKFDPMQYTVHELPLAWISCLCGFSNRYLVPLAHIIPPPSLHLSSRTLRAAINKCGLLKLRNFCKAKDTVNKTKWQPAEREKTFTSPTFDRGLIFKIYKELKKLDIKIPNNPIKNDVQIETKNS